MESAGSDKRRVFSKTKGKCYFFISSFEDLLKRLIVVSLPQPEEIVKYIE